jgi:hypothetical protein
MRFGVYGVTELYLTQIAEIEILRNDMEAIREAKRKHDALVIENLLAEKKKKGTSST